MIRTTIIGGVLFLLPVVILVLLLGKALQISMLVARPITENLPVERLAGVALVELVGVIVLLAICYGAGRLATMPAIQRRVGALDGALVDMIPPYAFLKTVVGSVARAEDEAGMLIPVLVEFDDHAQMAFEVERKGSQVVVYLPGSPSPWSGSTVVVGAERVRPLKVAPHAMAKMVTLLGRGSLAATKQEGGASTGIVT